MAISRYKAINIPRMLYETLRAYFSVNSAGKVNDLYKYCACLVQPLIAPFTSYETERIENGLIANSKWQMGQTTNVLNYLYDSVNNSIYITQVTIQVPSVTGFQYPAIQQVRSFGGLAVQVRGFNDRSAQTAVIINIPSYVNLAEITATVNQLIIQGIVYQFNIF